MIRKLFHFIFVLLLLALIIAVPANWMLRRSYNDPEVHYFYTEEKVQNGGESLRFAVLSDLYNYVFEGGNGAVSELVADTSPDAILISGNMITSDAEDLSPVTDLIRDLVRTAPVYYAYGDQELKYVRAHTGGEENPADPLRDLLEKAGATVISGEYKDVVLYGIPTRIGSINDRAYELTMPGGSVKRKYEDTYKLLKAFQDTDSFKVMIASRPESFVYGDACKSWDVDLVVSGGNLGGLVVLPRLGGVFGDANHYFPEYVHGMYEKDGVNLFITSGLSAPKGGIPRFNNPPEVAVLDIKGLDTTQDQ